MRRPIRKCRKCGCTETTACVEFDVKGRGHPCHWVSADICSACSSSAASLIETKASNFPPLVVAPQLAGYVARRR